MDDDCMMISSSFMEASASDFALPNAGQSSIHSLHVFIPVITDLLCQPCPLSSRLPGQTLMK